MTDIASPGIRGSAVLNKRRVRINSKTATADGELKRDATWRHARVSIAAYYLAQQRNFEPGFDSEDWKLAELQIDRLDESGAS